MTNTGRGQSHYYAWHFLKCACALVWILQCIQPLFSCCYFGDDLISNHLDESKGNLSLNQTCAHDAQCKGMKNGRIYLQYINRRKIDEPCKTHLQCRGTKNAGVCSDNKKCTCNEGFIRAGEGCVQGEESSFRFWKTGNWFLFITGGVIGTIVSLTSVLLVLKRRNLGKKRFDCNCSKKMPVNAQSEQQMSIPLESIYSDPIENNYSELHQTEEGNENVNIYHSGQPLGCDRREDSEDNVYPYNHLNETSLQILEGVYDVSEAR